MSHSSRDTAQSLYLRSQGLESVGRKQAVEGLDFVREYHAEKGERERGGRGETSGESMMAQTVTTWLIGAKIIPVSRRAI
jgi:hypothetical protein